MLKRLLPVLLLAAACATTSSKLPGKYAVVIDPRMNEPSGRAIPSVGESILRGLHDRFADITRVSSERVTGYDGVIVIRYGAGNLFGPSTPQQGVSRFTIVEYEILREGRSTARGDVRLLGLRRPEGMTAMQAATVKEALEHGIEVSRAVAKALAQP
ncbi:MAG TPA: hypothetical protein VHL59_17625 [Thermoanaerobaculia bacterium]|nr:hypothetical protein [Thermoanaerobaculia bacterium]